MPIGSVVIVTYNSAEYIACCIAAVLRAEDWKVVVVDNASDDASVAVVRQAAPNSCVIANSENRGFAAAVNQGVKAAEGEVLVLVNPDVIPTTGALDKLAQALLEGTIGAAGGMLASPDGAPQKGFTLRRLPTLGSAMAEILLLNRLWPRNPWNRSYRCFNLDHLRAQDVEQPAGACLAISRRVWQDLGGFDESFSPVWFEDVDFCRRLRDRGWKIRYCPEAVFVHAGGHSVKKLSFREQQSYWYKNLLRYFRKHHRFSAVLCLRAGIAVGLTLRSSLSLMGLGPSGVPIREAVAAYWQVVWHYAVLGRREQSDSSAQVLTSTAV